MMETQLEVTLATHVSVEKVLTMCPKRTGCQPVVGNTEQGVHPTGRRSWQALWMWSGPQTYGQTPVPKASEQKPNPRDRSVVLIHSYVARN